MNISIQKISIRGTLAHDIHREWYLDDDTPLSTHASVLCDILNASSDDFICLADGGAIIIGKKSEIGQFLPDW